MASGNKTKKRLTLGEKKARRDWINSRLDAGIPCTQIIAEAEPLGISEGAVYLAAREHRNMVGGEHDSRKRGVRSVAEIVVAGADPVERVDAEVLPKTREELQKWVHDNFNSPPAIAQQFLALQSIADGVPSLAKIQAINAIRELVAEYDVQEGVPESISLVPYAVEEDEPEGAK